MSANTDALDEAGRQLATMRKLNKVFESGIITDIEGLVLDLSPAQITTLVDNFTAARTACIAEMNKVSG